MSRVPKMFRDLPDYVFCPACNKVKPRESYNRASSRPTGTQPYCRNCQRTYQRGYEVDYPDLTRNERQAAERWALNQLISRHADEYREAQKLGLEKVAIEGIEGLL